MKNLHFAIPNNLSVLHDELLAAFPSLTPVRLLSQVPDDTDDADGLVPVMRVEGDSRNVWLTVPDGADESAIQAIVDAHDASATQRDLKAEARATGATKLKALGLTDDEIAALQG